MTRAQIDVLLGQLQPTVHKTRATQAPTVNVNCLLLDDAYEALCRYRDLLASFENPPKAEEAA